MRDMETVSMNDITVKQTNNYRRVSPARQPE